MAAMLTAKPADGQFDPNGREDADRNRFGGDRILAESGRTAAHSFVHAIGYDHLQQACGRPIVMDVRRFIAVETAPPAATSAERSFAACWDRGCLLAERGQFHAFARHASDDKVRVIRRVIRLLRSVPSRRNDEGTERRNGYAARATVWGEIQPLDGGT
jgi:hypothetical protein